MNSLFSFIGRKHKDKEPATIEPEFLFFGQQHPHTIEYFQKTFGNDWTRIPIKKSPHYLFVAGDEKPYRDYLANSWRYFYGDEIPSDKVEEQIAKFKKLIVDIKKTRVVLKALELYWAVDGELVIADGNHRSSIAAFLGIKCSAFIKNTKQQAIDLINIPEETFGSSVNNMPYQSIYHGRQVLVQGRRDDLIIRLNAIKKAFPIEGKTLLDFGSNYGMSSYLALRLGGVKQAHLVESSRHVTQAAIRLSVLLNNPSETYSVGDLRNDLSKTLPVCDIGFCFSISAHVGEIENLANMLCTNVKEAVFYETHEGGELEPVIAEKFRMQKKLCDLGRRQLYMLSN